MAKPRPEIVSHRMFSPLSTRTRSTHHRIDAMPNHQVDQVGVRNLGWIFARALGSAPCAAIDRVVRAVGRIVVCVEAIAEVSTAIMRSLFQGAPTMVVRTSSGLFARNLGPLYAVVAKATTTYVPTRTRVESTVATPEERRPSRVSSLTLAAVSHPQ